jgi:hypothetical protein
VKKVEYSWKSILLKLTVRGPEWMSDPYFLSPGAESLLTLFGAEHSLGGIPGYEVTETTDENPEHVALIQLVGSSKGFVRRSKSNRSN